MLCKYIGKHLKKSEGYGHAPYGQTTYLHRNTYKKVSTLVFILVFMTSNYVIILEVYENKYTYHMYHCIDDLPSVRDYMKKTEKAEGKQGLLLFIVLWRFLTYTPK